MMDRGSRSRVPGLVRSSCALTTVLLAAAVAACGGKSKGGGTTPAASAAGGGGGEAAAGGGGEAGGGVAEGGGETGSGGDVGEPVPGVRPPGLDLPPEEKQKRTMEHVKRAQEALDNANDPNFAITEAKAALAVDETSVEAMVLLAQAEYAKGYYDQAEDVLGKALERNGGKNRKLHFLMGLLHEHAKRYDQALDSYAKAVELDSSYKPAVMNLGVQQLRRKKWQDAANTYERLTGQLGYRTAASMTNLGSAYRGLSAEFTTSDVAKRNELLLRAEGTYKKALDLNKNYANAYYDLGLLYLDADPFPEGKDDMDLIKRLQRAKSFFDEYRRLPGADQKLADDQVAVAQKLIEREEHKRQKAAELEAKRKTREAKDKAREEREKKEQQEQQKQQPPPKQPPPKPDAGKGAGGK